MRSSEICKPSSWLLWGQWATLLCPSDQPGKLTPAGLSKVVLIKNSHEASGSREGTTNVKQGELQPRRLVKGKACHGLRKPQLLRGHRAVFPSCILAAGRNKWRKQRAGRGQSGPQKAPRYQTRQQCFPYAQGCFKVKWDIF